MIYKCSRMENSVSSIYVMLKFGGRGGEGRGGEERGGERDQKNTNLIPLLSELLILKNLHCTNSTQGYLKSQHQELMESPTRPLLLLLVP